MESSEFSLRLQEAKKISIPSYLRDMGYAPSTETGSTLIYLSPLPNHSERVPSFNVSKTTNRWKDFGTGERGDIVDLVQKMESVSMVGAVDRLLGERSVRLSSFTAEKRDKKNVEIVNIGEIESPWLTDYLAERKIPLDIAKQYLKELTIRFPYGRFPERTSKVLGFRNDAGGWEMRSRSLKISNSPKNITTIKSTWQHIVLIEGFFSFLSFKTLAREFAHMNDLTFVVLNSLSFLPQLIEFWNEESVIYGYLDNDRAGDKATETMKGKFPRFFDKRSVYAEYSDLNDSLTGKKKIKTIKEVING